MTERVLAALLLCFATSALPARAGDSGPRGDIARIRSDAPHLLAHELRLLRIEPKSLIVSDVAVVKDAATFSWAAGTAHGAVTLQRRNDRWWLASPRGYSCANMDICEDFDGYRVQAHFIAAATSETVRLQLFYGRAPSPAELLPVPLPPHAYVGANAVFFFSVTFAGTKPVSISRGSTIDVWFPFALDDRILYNFSMVNGPNEVGPVIGTLFDNIEHFELPAFTATPGQEFMGEVDGLV